MTRHAGFSHRQNTSPRIRTSGTSRGRFKFQATWAEDKHTSLENHKKRVEQQRAQHSDPLIPNLSQIVTHMDFKDVQTSDCWHVQFRTLENLGNTYSRFWEKHHCGQKQGNQKTTRKEKEMQRDRENQLTKTKTTTRIQDKNPTRPSQQENRREEGKRDYEYEYGNWRGQYPHYCDRWHDNWKNQSSGRLSSSGWQDWSRYW